MIKPEFFDDPDVGELSPLARLLFIGMWLQADREGRLKDDMRQLKARIFPYDAVDVEALAVELHGKDMIRRYQDVEKHDRFIWIRNFLKHQRPHPKEPPSLIPICDNGDGKKHGEPCKKTEGTSDPLESKDSGSFNLDPLESNGTRNLEIRTVPAALPAKSSNGSDRTPAQNIKVITKIAHEVLNQNGHRADTDAIEAVKQLCAKRHIAYDSTVIRKALDSAEAQSA